MAKPRPQKPDKTPPTETPGRDEVLALCVARGSSIRAAGKAASCSERTASRLLNLPAFQQRVSGLRAELVRRAVGVLSDAATAAAVTLKRLLSGEAESTRLSAAKAIIDLSIRLTEFADLSKRVEALESETANADIQNQAA
jgi:hypothetical protein